MQYYNNNNKTFWRRLVYIWLHVFHCAELYPFRGLVSCSLLCLSPYPSSPALCCQDTTYTWRPAICATHMLSALLLLFRIPFVQYIYLVFIYTSSFTWKSSTSNCMYHALVHDMNPRNCTPYRLSRHGINDTTHNSIHLIPSAAVYTGFQALLDGIPSDLCTHSVYPATK